MKRGVDPIAELTGRNADVARKVVAQIEAQAQAQAHASDVESRSGNRSRIARESSVISVWGERGTGKSSVLGAVADYLTGVAKQRFRVVGPIQPEMFGATDTVLSVALSLLRSEIDSAALCESSEFQDDQMAELQESLQAAHMSATISQASQNVLAQSSETVAEFARQLQRVTSAGVGLWSDFDRVVSILAGKPSRHQHIVVIVDDPDLAPLGHTGQVFRDVRNIGSTRGVTVLVAGNHNSVQSALTRLANLDGPAPKSEIAANEAKVFPWWGMYTLSDPSWSERVGFRPPSQDDTLQTLLAQCGMYSPSDPTLLARVLGSWDPILIGMPLPGRMRALAQLWIYFDTWRRAEATTIERTRAESLRDLCDRLMTLVWPPTDVGSWGITWGAPAGSDERRLRFSIRTTPLTPGLSAKGGFLPPASEDEPDGVAATISLRAISRVGMARWRARRRPEQAPENDPDASPDDMAMILAVQELLCDSGLFELDDEATAAAGIDPNITEFCQVVRIANLETDDYMVTLPLIKSWSLMARAVHSWNAFAERSRTESLPAKSILALSIEAALAITRNAALAVDAAIPTYGEALDRLEQELQRIDELADDEWTLAQQELINWYVGFVPAHWHSAIFTESEIHAFAGRWAELIGRFCSQVSDGRVYRPLSLGSRIKRYLDECNEPGTTRKHAWLGGYRAAVAAMRLDVDTTRFARVGRAWDDHLRSLTMGSSAIGVNRMNYTPVPSVSHKDANTGSSGSLSAYGDEYGAGLMEEALDAIEKWERSADPFRTAG